MRKVIVIGLDGGTWDVLKPLMDRGLLPGIKSLVEEGAWGRLRTVIPPGTGPAWSTIVTGLDPSNHGIADLIVRAEGSYDLAFLNAASLRAPTMWDLVGDRGGKVLVLNVPMTYPPAPVNGYMATGLLTPSGDKGWAYPEEFADLVRKVEPSYKVVPDRTYVPGEEDAFIEEMTALVKTQGRVFTHFAGSLDCSFVMQVFSETDFLQHALWFVMDPSHPRHKPSQAGAYAERIEEFYKALDRIVADASRGAEKDTSVVVISDHGSGPLHEFIHANNVLLEKGLLRIKPGFRSRLKYLLFRAGFTPLNAYRFMAAARFGRVGAKAGAGLRWTSKGYELIRRLFFSFSDIDWPRSKAYAISGGVYGGLFVNLAGREPSGAVSQEDYESVRQELKRTLLGLRHPRTGAPLVREVLGREEIYAGRFLGELPDLYFLPSEATQAVFGDFEFSSNRAVEPASPSISAQHRMEGVFAAKGAAVRRGVEVKGMTVADIMPLVLYLMDLPIPRGLDGKLNSDVIEPTELSGRPPVYFEPGGADGFAGRERKATDDESIKERLKGLGYIS